MNFYASAVNHLICNEGKNPTIGDYSLPFETKKYRGKFALDTVHNPIWNPTHTLREDLPEALRESLPSAGQLQMELEAAAKALKKQKQRVVIVIVMDMYP